MKMALEQDPDNTDFVRAIKNVKRSTEMKEEATELFKAGKYK